MAAVVNRGDGGGLAALLTMGGSPFAHYGEEPGMSSKGDRDENKRLPMHWPDAVFLVRQTRPRVRARAR
ncbi:MAG: hypothetical protein ABFC62_03965 [Clostridiaceae bacterium]|nr:hypothetical protein [Eubacteriales bacterium]